MRHGAIGPKRYEGGDGEERTEEGEYVFDLVIYFSVSRYC